MVGCCRGVGNTAEVWGCHRGVEGAVEVVGWCRGVEGVAKVKEILKRWWSAMKV